GGGGVRGGAQRRAADAVAGAGDVMIPRTEKPVRVPRAWSHLRLNASREAARPRRTAERDWPSRGDAGERTQKSASLIPQQFPVRLDGSWNGGSTGNPSASA